MFLIIFLWKKKNETYISRNTLLSHLFVWQEDDLFTMAYGLPLDGDGDEKCLSLLNAVEETISRQLRACKAPSSRRRVLEGCCQITCLNPMFLLFLYKQVIFCQDCKGFKGVTYGEHGFSSLFLFF